MARLGAQMACGDKKACPKGGRPEYRNGPQYELVQGRQPVMFTLLEKIATYEIPALFQEFHQ